VDNPGLKATGAVAHAASLLELLDLRKLTILPADLLFVD
jgi:hypothetical protein